MALARPPSGARRNFCCCVSRATCASIRAARCNASLTDWPKTLRGEAAEIYLHWERELKPRGFHLMARVLDYPNGMPGDIGLFLGWTG